MIILICFSIKIIRIKTIAAEINLITKDYFKIGMFFFNFLIIFFYFNCVRNRIVVCDCYCFMSKFECIIN